MVGYLSQRCGSCYQRMRLTPMNTLLKLDGSCMTWLSWPLRHTLKIRRAIRFRPLGRREKKMFALLAHRIVLRIRRMAQHDTGLLNLRQHISAFFLFRLWRWWMNCGRRESVDSAKSRVVRSVSQVELSRLCECKMLKRTFYTPVFHPICVHRTFLFNLAFALRKLCSPSPFVNYWMLLGEVFILPARYTSDVASLTDRRTMVIERVQQKENFFRILPPRVRSREYMQS